VWDGSHSACAIVSYFIQRESASECCATVGKGLLFDRNVFAKLTSAEYPQRRDAFPMSRRPISQRPQAHLGAGASRRIGRQSSALLPDGVSADKSRLAAIVESSSDAIISWTPDGILDTWNQGAKRLYGYSAAEVIGRPVSILIPPHLAGDEAAIMKKVRRGQCVDHYETQRLARDGRLVDISLTASPIKDARGALIGVAAVGRDIRERKRSEIERGQLVHQLRERIKELTAIYGVAHVLQMETKSTMALLQEITSLLPPAWQYPEVTAARVQVGDFEFKTPNFHSSCWSQKATFTATDGRKGMVEVVYLSERPQRAEGPFLAEERALIDSVAEAVKAYWERRRLESKLLEISEREQRRIGQDLHDGISQHLRGIAYLNHVLYERLAERNRPEAAESARITQLLEEVMDQARSLARGLFPVALEATGLMDALRALGLTVRDIYKRDCRFVCPKPVPMYENLTATHLFRIAQEAVNNAIRHGNATRIVISLSIRDEVVVLSVRDNGRGFPASLPETRGMGLEIMKHRARMIDGRLSHRPIPRGGTVLVCMVPALRDSRMKRAS